MWILKKTFYFLIIILFLGITQSVSAQVRDSDISISVSPEAPGPMTNVTVTISSFSTDLDKAQISWSLDSQPVLIGIGKKTFSFKTGDSGEVSTIDVFINIAGAPAISKRLIIQPGEVDLLWEAVDSYVPPFYRGKALLSSEGKIKVTAIPNITTPSGVKLKTSDFSYDWKRNFEVDQGASGYNKNSFTFLNNYLEGIENVSVSASSVLGTYSAEGKTVITPSTPKIVFYEHDPYLGVRYNKAIMDGFTMKNKELQITTIPYFFSAKIDSSDLRYNWSINNSPISAPATPNNLAVKVGDGTGSQAKISLSVDNLSKLFQTASISALLNIEK